MGARVIVWEYYSMEHAMHLLTQSAFQTLDEVWASIYDQCQTASDPAYQASLWRMAGNICTGYALQHRTAQDVSSANSFEWLALICDQRQLMALKPSALEVSDPVKLAIVQSLPRVH